MLFKRLKSEGLAHNSYLIGSGSQAAVVDPRRDCQVYVDLAREEGMKIGHIFETHRNEDYVVGSTELSNMTGAETHHGPGLAWKYGSTLSDGDEFSIGKLRLTAIHTPGHTDESMSYVLFDASSGNAAVIVFTGDALFVGDVGRTDLYGEDEVRRLATTLYRSLFERVLPLGDGTILCPAHGAGSVCGMNIADRDESTLGIERAQNPALQFRDCDSFVKHKLSERPERPPYFRQMEVYNVEGPPVLGCLPQPDPLTAKEFRRQMEEGAVVVDTSAPAAFGGAHISDSYSIWLEGLSVFAGWLLPYDRPILLVLEEQHDLDSAIRNLIRVGYDRIAGYLKGGVEGWYLAGYPVEYLRTLSVHDLKARLDRGEEITVIDDRSPDEWEKGHIKGSRNIYVGHLPEHLDDIPKDKPVAFLCSVGRRAGMGASILLREGCREVYNVVGSMSAWKAADYPVTTE